MLIKRGGVWRPVPSEAKGGREGARHSLLSTYCLHFAQNASSVKPLAISSHVRCSVPSRMLLLQVLQFTHGVPPRASSWTQAGASANREVSCGTACGGWTLFLSRMQMMRTPVQVRSRFHGLLAATAAAAQRAAARGAAASPHAARSCSRAQRHAHTHPLALPPLHLITHPGAVPPR